ncbi:MAG: thioredoxin fold domain-containing protein [candidate division Zixibacteria bacterium]|nr:thioredoxin fold domain-containing protein [candidate division Zixibacteria bacterium]
MTLKKLGLIVLTFVIVTGFILSLNAGDSKDGKPAIKFYSYEEGIRKASKDSVHVAVFFETTWCGYCKKMHKTTLTDERIISMLNEDFVAVQVDGDRQKNLVRDYGVRGYPSTWFLKPDASKIAPAPGYWPTEDFYWLLRYIKDSAYEKEQFKAYVDRKKKEEQG